MFNQNLPQTSEEAIRVGQQDIYEKFGIAFSGVEEGKAHGELILTSEHRNVYGVPYGGVMFHLADITAGMAFLSAGGNGITVSGNVNYLRGANPNAKKLLCQATVKKSGRKLFFINAEVSDDSGKILSEYSFIFTNHCCNRHYYC